MTRAERREDLEARVYRIYDTIDCIQCDFPKHGEQNIVNHLLANIASLEKAVKSRGGYGRLLVADLDEMESYLEEREIRADELYARAENAYVMASMEPQQEGE